MVHVVRTLPAKYMLRSFGQHTLEAHTGCDGTYLIVVDKRTVAQHLGGMAEEFLHLLHLPLGLTHEAVGIHQ